jgi:hypothetical protein
MKIPHSPLHLTYCTNIHPGESWDAVFQNLQTYLPSLKQNLSPDRPFGIGLRLANIASLEILEADRLQEFKRWLAQHDLYVFTLNGFPYGSFHRQVVKDQVYAPDWFQLDRANYTKRLIHILAELLPAGMAGSISTLPISYKPWWEDGHPDTRSKNSAQAAETLAMLSAELAQLEQTTGKYIHIGLEPEPDGLIENTEEVIDWFQSYLLTDGTAYLQSQGYSAAQAQQTLLRHIQVCYDTCHFAVEFEQPAQALDRLTQAGIGISKVQLSSALRIPVPQSLNDRQTLLHTLQPFAESTYLHQVIAQRSDGQLDRYRDLEIALQDWLTTEAQEWRTHFHVPLFLADYPPLSSTQLDIQQTLAYLVNHPICQHLEIETYTWEVLPTAMKLDIATSIQREYEWVLQTIQQAIPNSNSFVAFPPGNQMMPLAN